MQAIEGTEFYTDGKHNYTQKNLGNYVVYILVEETVEPAAKTVKSKSKKTVSLDEIVVLKSV